MKTLKKYEFENDGLEVREFSQLQQPEFMAYQNEIYSDFKPGRNAVNQLARAVRFGVYAKGQFTWLNRNNYSLPEKLNQEEGGRVREFDLIPEEFLRTPEIESLFAELFEQRGFTESSDDRAYEIQLSAIRYEPTIAETCFPSPGAPHQDMVDGAIVVLRKMLGLVGGQSRLYTVDGSPLYEYDLKVGEALTLRDADYKHQVGVLGFSLVMGHRRLDPLPCLCSSRGLLFLNR